MRTRTILGVLLAASTGAADVGFLPAGSNAAAVVSDGSGNTYIGGSREGRGFITRWSTGGGAVEFYALPAGQASGITALAIGPDGSVFATGSFSDGTQSQALVVKVGADGRQSYLARIPGDFTAGLAIAVNAEGEALVGGRMYDVGGSFAATSDALAGTADVTGFLVKLDTAGAKTLVAFRTLYVSRVAFDSRGDIYAAGIDWMNAGFPTTPGAFQSKHDFQSCGGAGFFLQPCPFGYVTKISGDGSKLLYSTFLAGHDGSFPSGMAIDADGNAIIAGSTSASDYPVTASAFQTAYRVRNTYPIIPSPHGYSVPPPQTAYVTKLNRDGTALVWSTFLSGTGSDAVTSLAMGADGRIVLAGLSGSRDFPGAQAVADACAPALAAEVPFFAELSADGTALLASRFVFGLAAGIAPAVASGSVIAAGDTVASVEATAATQLTCSMDSADFARIAHVAPGQLVSFFGDEFDGATVTVDGFAGAVLYASREQVNARIPVEVAGRDVVEAVITAANGVSTSRHLRVVPRAASAFLDAKRVTPANPYQSCEGSGSVPGSPPVARNEDGALNSCATPAASGSVVTLFLNGIGTGTPAVSLRNPDEGTVVGFEPDPDSPPGVWRLQVRLARAIYSVTLDPLLDGVPLRDLPSVVWVRP